MSRTPAEADWKPGTIFTVGHSTRSIEDFIALLRAYEIRQLVDIRTVPRSRFNPQFNGEGLRDSLAAQAIRYSALPALGGLRKARADSPNGAWRNASFRGYADHMQTAEFATGLQQLLRLSEAGRTAIMCAEAVPWRCHRSLVGDALLVRGIPVIDILSESDWRPHKLTPFAQVDGRSVTYPPDQANLL